MGVQCKKNIAIYYLLGGDREKVCTHNDKNEAFEALKKYKVNVGNFIWTIRHQSNVYTYILTQSLNSHETRHLIHSLFIFRVKSQHHSNKRYPNICPCSIRLICTIRKMLFECLFLIGYSISKESPCCQSIEDC